MGDEGSGFWLGIRALQAVMRAGDGRDRATVLTERVFADLKVRTLEDAAMWLYSPEKPPAREVAWLAPIVIEEAEANDVVAVELVETAAQELALLGQTVIRQLEIENPRIAFAGGLLESDHILTRRLCALLGLSERPTPRYPPVIGAAILAQLAIESQENLAG
jgi:N-acetylglucosamine kinase-like BadF-type ATPase